MMGTLLVIYLVLFIGVTLVGRSYLVWRHTGINPYTLGKSDSAHDHIGRLFRVSVALVIGVVAVYTWAPAVYELLTPIGWLEYIWLDAAGVILLCLALIWIVFAQVQMGDAWRIGIDTAQTHLVRQGLFRISRNPVFLGMRALLLGLFLVLPNALTLALWLLGDSLLQIQVRLEEEHLRGQHGETYASYQQRVRRWL